MNIMKEWIILTVEHRRYAVKAETKKGAIEYMTWQADLTPKDTNIKLVDMGDFEIVD